jgi:hypothetical protein
MKNNNLTPAELLNSMLSIFSCIAFYFLIITGTFDVLFFDKITTHKILWTVTLLPVILDLIILKQYTKRRKLADLKENFLFVMLLFDLTILIEWLILSKITFVYSLSKMKVINTGMILIIFFCVEAVLAIIDHFYLIENAKKNKLSLT